MNKKITFILVQVLFYISILALVATQLASCNRTTGKQSVQWNNEVNKVQQWISPQWPKDPNDYKTTDSGIYLANLNSSITVFNRLYKTTKNAQYGTQLASKLYFRFRVLGDFNDAITAIKLISKVSQENNTNPSTYLTLASIQSGFHQFQAALDSLKSAQALGIKTKNLQQLANEVRYSLGQYQPYHIIINNTEISVLTKAKYALVNNKFRQASKYYKQAMHAFNDTDPYKLSWLQLQQGIAFLRYGDLHSAKIFFKSAHDRFPEYYLVTEHLAETEYLLGNLSAAKQLYQQVIAQTNNPEFYAQLAKVEASLGNITASKKALKQAQSRFDKLTRNYPKATGDHAVDFYLDNNQQQTGLDLAQLNLQNRKNIESYQLLIHSALANNNIQLACRTFTEANKLNVIPLEFYQLSSELTLSCSNKPTTTH